MHIKTMEGLVGAKTNMDLLNTPFRVFKEARRRGDTAVMERAMGYVGEFSDEAEGYKVKADEGMKEDAKEARKGLESEREEAIRKRKEEREELEKRTEEKTREESGEAKPDIGGSTGSADDVSVEPAGSAVKKAPVFYTKTGKAEQGNAGAHISVSV